MNYTTHTYRNIAASVLVAVVVNLFVPAAFGAAQLFCQEVPSVHSVGRHASSHCCQHHTSNADNAQLTHTSCSLGQVCEQILTDEFSGTPIVLSNAHRIVGTPAPALTLDDPIKHLFNSPSPDRKAIPFAALNIYVLNSTFLN